MKITRTGLILLGAIAVTGLTPARGGDEYPPPPAQVKPEKESQKFKGKVDSVDVKSRTLMVDGKLVYTTDTTTITKAGKKIALARIMDGDEVYGTTRLTTDGKTEALTVKVGREEDEQEEPAPKE